MMFVYLLIAFALCSRPGRLTFLYDCLSLVVYIDVQLLGIWYLVIGMGPLCRHNF